MIDRSLVPGQQLVLAFAQMQRDLGAARRPSRAVSIVNSPPPSDSQRTPCAGRVAGAARHRRVTLSATMNDE